MLLSEWKPESKVHRREQDFSEAVIERSMARFLPSWYNFSGLHECRGTMLLDELKTVTLKEPDKCAPVQCRDAIWLEG